MSKYYQEKIYYTHVRIPAGAYDLSATIPQ